MPQDSSDLEAVSPQTGRSTPWYHPDVATLEGARRAIRPGVWLTGGYALFLVVQFIYLRIFNAAALGDYDAADILVVAPVFTAVLILFALKASRIAIGLMTMSGIATIRHGVDVLLANEMLAGTGLTLTGIALTGLCAIGFAAAVRYQQAEQGQSGA